MSAAHILEVKNLGRWFGAFKALDGVSARFGLNRVTAVIGPNGAGKSTLFNILSGALRPSTGSIFFKGTDLGQTPQHEFVHLGIARTYQITNVFPHLTAHENVRIAAQAFRSRYNIWTPRSSLHEISAHADQVLVDVGLGARRARLAALLSHGEQRALEIAIALVADPQLLLLDEPTAGMGPEETKQMIVLIEHLAQARTILLVEHKMKMVLGLCDRILVLHLGRLIADGTPTEIRSDAFVRAVYLGQSDGYA